LLTTVTFMSPSCWHEATYNLIWTLGEPIFGLCPV